MKCFFALSLAILAAGCTQKPTIEFTGITPGINDGEFIIKNISDSTICKTAIKSGTFTVSSEYNNGTYGYMSVNNDKLGMLAFDVYLQPGKYTVTFDRDKPYKYPDIQSTVKKQNELTAYYHLFDKTKDELSKKAADLNAQLKDPKSQMLPADAYNNLVNKYKEAEQQQLKLATIVLSAFVDKYPDNSITPRIIVLNNAYMSNPDSYYRIFQKLSSAAKESPEGKAAKGLLERANNLTNK
ncbi:hypothetical protein [Mucilaginibacter sp.]|uniref:hypothetical protein n=1 Tax=Mucilaginibacter sp. TaxID=1882438 RepID=UPI00261091B9|nr:hypothetical protein [Mucilaginibacter sp.]